VIPHRRIASAPSSNPALLGIRGRNGVFYHVFDLGRMIGGGAGGEGGHLVLLRGEPPVGLRVDAVLRVADVAAIDADAASGMRPSHPAVTGFVRPILKESFEGRVISLLDTAVLTSGDQRGRVEGDVRVDQ
jgi:chemotaxis signal transduction protein